jgi:hypothetical protein
MPFGGSGLKVSATTGEQASLGGIVPVVRIGGHSREKLGDLRNRVSQRPPRARTTQVAPPVRPVATWANVEADVPDRAP